jgi:ADP-ribosylglycohydrolase
VATKLPQENYIACLVGGAIGDALGAAIEFLNIHQIIQKYGPSGVTGYVEFADATGEFTDDTQMTLFTAEGLLGAMCREDFKGTEIATNRIVYQSYLRWLQTQEMPMKFSSHPETLKNEENGWLITQNALFKRRAPGNSCLSALRSGVAGSIEKPINDSKGCGGIMRVAPVGLVLPGENEKAFATGCNLAAITHGHPSGYLSAGFFASLISDLAVAIPFEQALQNATTILQKREGMEETLFAVQNAINLYNDSKILLKSSPEKIPQFIEKLGLGWVGEEALAISLFCCLLYPDNFEKGVLAAINHSGDSDSTGSITGNILGLINGLNKIPEGWITNLRNLQLVEKMGKELFNNIWIFHSFLHPNRDVDSY